MDPNSLIPTNGESWLARYKDFLLILAGGLFTVFGVFAGIWYREIKARIIKTEKTIGEQKK